MSDQTNEIEVTKPAPANMVQYAEQDPAGYFSGIGVQMPNDPTMPEITMEKDKPLFNISGNMLIPELIGHILNLQQARTYFDRPFNPNDAAPPRCESLDMIRPRHDRVDSDGVVVEPCAELCSECPYAKWEKTEHGNKMQCKEEIRMWFLRDGDLLPSFIRVRSTSCGKKESLRIWWSNAGSIGFAGAYQTIKVRLTLMPRTFDNGSSQILQVQTILDAKGSPAVCNNQHSYLATIARWTAWAQEDAMVRTVKQREGDA